MKAGSITVVVLLVLVGCLISYTKGHSVPTPQSTSKTSSTTLSVNGFQYEVVTTPAAQERGLGGRTDIPENYGMLFVFPEDASYGFWMKDMLAPIDMVWLSDKGTILKIDAEVATSSYPSVFYPPEPVRYVLETRAGESQRQGWEVGTQLSIPFTN
ncbi:MAG TPA: DUF192 domain-containing protein [Candidatus Paceibacterota bacterium]|nr:DUF192 domain-containing protein [Candidatus Paceibacterota bacterium]